MKDNMFVPLVLEIFFTYQLENIIFYSDNTYQAGISATEGPIHDVYWPVGDIVTLPFLQIRFLYTDNEKYSKKMKKSPTHKSMDEKKLHMLISGSSGLIGRRLVPCLIAAGHSVTKLVRYSPQAGEPSLFWDPEAGIIDLSTLKGLDAVIHLAGESIVSGRWSEKKKKQIRDSRTRGTRLLAETLAFMQSPPEVMISASAVGYYGNRGEELLNESSSPGNGFLAEVCSEWETACEPAAGGGIRVVNLRLGTVLSNEGGALAAMLPAFKTGLGGKLGSGEQYMSWISLDDTLRSILHCLFSSTVSGPVNVVAPNPVKNRVFARIIARVLGRPAFCHLPAFILKTVLGQMAEELLLTSTRVEPAKLQRTGFVFRYSDLENTLRYLLC
jgi:uncharacterized protein